MKRIIFMMLSILLAVSLAACGSNTDSREPGTTAGSVTSQPAELAEPEATGTDAEAVHSEETFYEFEFTDIDGNVHKLSDYRGKPVFLRVWASWCGVCTSSLEEFDKLAGEAEEFVILSVVMPSMSGELSAEEFTEWYKAFGYENLVVMFDNEAQIIRDFGINAFPSQIMFDAEGHVVYGMVGAMSAELITETMLKIANESA